MPTKVCPVTTMVFLGVMYGCENWIIKEAECWRIDAFELWCWRRLLRVLWTARWSKQSILREINPEYSLDGQMQEPKLQYFGYLMWRINSMEKAWCWQRLKAGEGDNRGWDDWMASPTRWTWVWASSRIWWWTGKPGVLQDMGSQRVIHNWVNWNELNWTDRHLKCVCVCVVVQSCRTETLIYGIRCHLQVESVRIELNYRVPSSCLRSAYFTNEKLHPTPPNWEFGTKLFQYIYMSK